MEKIYKLLHKRYDGNFSKSTRVKNKREDMEKMFKIYRIDYSEDNELDFFNNEIIYQGIVNKRRLEDAHFEGGILMHDFYETLDYNEKRRLMNYEIEKAKPEVPSIVSEEQMIYIPFLDRRMNQIYDNEMVLFDIKKYNYYKDNFKQIMIDFHEYGNVFYNESFCSASLIYEHENTMTLYDRAMNCLYFVVDLKLVNHLTLINKVDVSVLKNLSFAFYNGPTEEFVELLIGLQLIREKDVKKVRKLLKKGK